MQLWQYVASADDRSDLCRYDKFREMAIALSHHARNADREVSTPVFYLVPARYFREYEKPTLEEIEQLATAVKAFRCAVERMKGQKSKRKARLTPQETTRVFDTHISCLCTGLKYKEQTIGPVVGYYHLPCNGDGTGKVRTFADACSQLWQCVFGSMVFDSFRGVCGRCGRQLGTTSTGKPVRTEYCRSCVEWHRIHRMPDEKRKRLKREAMQRYRRRDELKNQKLNLQKGEA